jgi:hypothetical protein
MWSADSDLLKPSQEIKEIVITESPIDALSHKQLHGTAHTLYLSTCGSIGKEIASSLETVFIQAKEQSIGGKLGFDGDSPGRAMAQQVAAIASKQGITCQMEWPSLGKDWNDMLVASKKQAAQLDEPKHATVLVGRFRGKEIYVKELVSWACKYSNETWTKRHL